MGEHDAGDKSGESGLYHNEQATIWTIEDPSLDPTTRLMYRDDQGRDWDVEALRDAVIAIHANTAPKAISLSPRLRIRAIHEICKQAMPDG